MIFFYGYLNNINIAWKNIYNYTKLVNLNLLYESFYNDNITIQELKTEIYSFLEKNKDIILANIPSFFTEKNLFYKELQKNLISKFKRMKKLKVLGKTENKNIQTAFMSALYMYFRILYNDDIIKKHKELHTALFLFIRNFSYSGMFRYSDKGKFNVPYGGTSYNTKTLDNKISYYQSDDVLNKLFCTEIENLDFEAFLKKYNPQENDFIFFRSAL